MYFHKKSPNWLGKISIAINQGNIALTITSKSDGIVVEKSKFSIRQFFAKIVL